MTVQRAISVVTAGLLSLVATWSAQAGIIAGWDFSTAANGPLSGYAASSYDSGISATPGLSTAGGVIVPSVTAGVLSYTTPKGNDANDINGCTFTLVLTASKANYSGLSVSFANVNSGYTGLSGQWSYWVGTGTPGTTTPVGSAINLATSGTPSTSLGSTTFSAGQTLELVFAMTETAGAHASSITFDDLALNGTVTPIPEPVRNALAVFGVILVSTGVGRWYHGRVKRACPS
ncbi:MAG: hypothetical protein ACLQU3_15595 [Limisphaerales bacterium]